MTFKTFFGPRRLPLSKSLLSLVIAGSTISTSLQAADFDFDNYSCTPFDQIGELNGSEKRTMTFVYHRVRSDSNGDGKIDHNDALTGDGYLVENVHSNGHLKVWDISNPGSPQMLGEYGGAEGDFFMGGHHNYTGMGAIMSWNKSGFSQVNLNDIPNWPAKGEDIRLEAYIDDVGTYHPDKPEMAFDRSFEANYGLAQGASPLSAWCSDGANKPTEPWVECDINLWYPLGVRRTPMPYGYTRMNNIVLHDMRFPNTYDSNGNMTSQGNPELSTIDVFGDLDFEGGVNIIGNLLIVRGFNESDPGIGIYDISDPSNPALLDSIRTRSAAYGGGFIAKSYNMTTQWENFFVLAMNGDTGFNKEIDIIDFDDPTNLQHVYHQGLDHNTNDGGTWGWSTRYPQFKDDHMYVGKAKVNMAPLRTGGAPQLVGTFSQGGNGYGAWGSDLLPIGNILVTGGQNMAGGARIYCNEATADTQGPTVAWHWPKNDGASNLNMHINSRIGVIIHEQLDWNTVNDSNFQIRDSSGNPIPVYVSWNDNHTVNISPQQALDLNATYTFFMPAGGVKDIAGNPLAADYSFDFSTGSSFNAAPELGSVTLSTAVVAVGSQVSLDASATDPNPGDTLTYTIDWGDGTTSNSNSANHSYSAPGIYTASVTVTDSQFQDSQNIKILVGDANAQTHSTSSSIIYNVNDDHIVNVNPDNNTLTAFFTDGTEKFKTPTGMDPRGVAFNAVDSEYWVTNYDDGTISIIDTEGALVQTIELNKGGQPFAILMDATHAYISAEAEGKLYKIDLNIDTANIQTGDIESIHLGPHPYAMAMNQAKDTLLVTRFVSPEDHGEVYRVDLNTFTLDTTIILNEISGQPELQTFSNGVPNYLTSVTFTPDGTKAVVGSKKDNVRRGDFLGNTGGSNAENTVRSMLSIVDLSTNTDLNAMVDIDNREMPSSLTFAHQGQILYVTHRGNNDITAYDANLLLNNFSLQQVHRQIILSAPTNIALAPDNSVYVHEFLERTVSNMTLFSGPSNSIDQFSSPTTWNTVEVLDDLLCPGADCTILEGKRLFYSAGDGRISLDGYISCAGCHNDGGEDKRVWDFTDRGEGLRNTISMVGRGGTGHGRVHWSANFDEIHDFEHDIRGPFGGTGLMENDDFALTSSTLGTPKAGKSSDLDALAAYVTSLNTFPRSPHRNNAGDDLTADIDIDGDGIVDGTDAANGKTIFNSLSCYSCHGGAEFTDSNSRRRHDVGTLKPSSGGRLGGNTLSGIDTPTLINLWNSAPYLHDGSAANIVDLLNSAAHGGTDTLTTQERKDLAAYLLQIDGLEPAALNASDNINITTFNHGDAYSDGEETLTLDISTTITGINSVQWFVNDQEVASISTGDPDFDGTWDATWTAVFNGYFRIYAKATYNNGLTATLSPENTIQMSSSALFGNGTVKVEAESYTFASDSDTTNTATGGCAEYNGYGVDVELGGDNCVVTDIANGESLTYGYVTIPQAGDYLIKVQNSGTTAGTIDISVNGVLSAANQEVLQPFPTGWDNYIINTLPGSIYLPVGTHEIKIDVVAAGFNLDWIEFNLDQDGDRIPDSEDNCYSPDLVNLDPNNIPVETEDTTADPQDPNNKKGCYKHIDNDGDNVPDYRDACPTEGGSVDINGCSVAAPSSIINTNNWSWSDWSGNGNITKNGESFNVDIITVDTVEPWRVQLNIPVSITTGNDYTICFDANANASRDLDFVVDTDASSYTPVGPTASSFVELTTSTQSFSHSFTADLSDSTSRLSFNMGGESPDLSISNVKIVNGLSCAGTGTGPSDSDFDGVEDSIDICDADSGTSNTPVGVLVDVQGCSYGDFDNDGVADNEDLCGTTAPGATVDAFGCELEDTDGDGVYDINDAFPLDPTESADNDGDGVGDNADVFDNDPTEWVDADGDNIGNNADPDDDNDGVNDVDANGDPLDAFPFDASEQFDSDSDGVGDNADQCDAQSGRADTPAGFPVDSSGCTSITIEAEDFADDRGLRVVNYATASNGQALGYVHVNDWADYATNIPAGSYRVTYRHASYYTRYFNIETGDVTPYMSVVMDSHSATGGWDDFHEASETIEFTSDITTLRLAFYASSINIDKLTFELDTDGDGIIDADDACYLDPTNVDTDGDGTCNLTDPDDDGDGFDDGVDNCQLDYSLSNTDTDGDNICNESDTDDDNDGYLDGADACPLQNPGHVDTDNDGICNATDTDDDGDGFNDVDDNCPLNSSSGNADSNIDTDNDGICNDNDPDDDGDGVNDGSDLCSNTAQGAAVDADGCELIDTDGDGVYDVYDAFPNDPTESADSDSDGVGDNADAFPNDANEQSDADSDGVGDNTDICANSGTTSVDASGCTSIYIEADSTSNYSGLVISSKPGANNGQVLSSITNDSWAEYTETLPAGNYLVTYSFASGWPTDSEFTIANTSGTEVPGVTRMTTDNSSSPDWNTFVNNSGSTAIANTLNGFRIIFTLEGFDFDAITFELDTDLDGIIDSADMCPEDATNEDTDGDGICNSEDTDDDGDGMPDGSDPCPLSFSNIDTDGDLTCDTTDLDDDNDGHLDTMDNCPLDYSLSNIDTDGDSTCNENDTNDDNDNFLDSADNCPLDPSTGNINTDGDDLCNENDTDDDGDGVDDTSDAFPLDGSESADTDSDGMGDNQDLCDNTPATAPIDANGCYVFVDTDGDDVPDYRDSCNGSAGSQASQVTNLDGCEVIANFNQVIETEDYDSQGGVQIGGGYYVGWINTNDWMQYNNVVNLPIAGNYTIRWRHAGHGSGKVRFKQNGSTKYTSSTLGNTSGWENWQNRTETVNLDAGLSTIRLEIASGADFNIEEFELSISGPGVSNDADHDGVLDDGTDLCLGSPVGVLVDADGCVSDSDGDGVVDTNDNCANTPAGALVDANGCELPDNDADGIYDINDNCPNDASAANINTDGDDWCDENDSDDDGDGIDDASDVCPLDYSLGNIDTDSDGLCNENDTNDDNDNFDDSSDNCPLDASIGNMNFDGDAYCDENDSDDDGDGVNDSSDNCANTPLNETADANGCSSSQIDSDNDGVADNLDTCADTPIGATVDSAGCPSDSDADGVLDGIDNCANTPAGATVDNVGCPSDADGDGVYDGIDTCASTPTGATVDAVGCPSDSDSDGVLDGIDACPGTPANDNPDANGCGDSQKDADGDGVIDLVDTCPNTPSNDNPDANGCGDSQRDTDGDGVMDDADTCANTPANDNPDANGCGDSQRDTDGDGVMDNADTCANTPANDNPDANGCGDSQRDSDGDGVNDNADNCPNTPANTTVDANGCEQTTTFDITFQAESYQQSQGVQTETCYDAGGGLNVGWIDAGDWMSEYNGINIPEAGYYTVEFRVAGNAGNNKSIKLEKAGGSVLYAEGWMNDTGGWQNWTTVTVENVYLPAGNLNPAIATSTGGFNINWIRIHN